MTHCESQELAAYALGMTETQWEDMLDEEREDELDGLIYDKFDTGLDGFTKIAEALIKFTPQVKTAIGGKVVNAFVRKHDSLGSLAIVTYVAE